MTPIITARQRTTRRLRRLQMASLMVTSLVIFAPVGAASAAVRQFSDPADASGIDIGSVRAQYGDWLRVTAKHDGRVKVGQTYRYWIDTNPANPGPEYYYAFYPNSDAGVVKKVDGFHDPTRQTVRCGRQWGGTADEFRPRQPVVALISGRCLGDPARVRVSFRFVEKDGSGDWAPGARKFSRWVARY